MRKKANIIFLILLTLILYPINNSEAIPYKSYTYNYWGNPTPAPQAYIPVKTVEMNTIISDLQDIFITANRNIYLVDAGNDQIIVLNENFEKLSIIKEFQKDGKTDYFNSPKGVFVSRQDEIFIADTNNGRIVILDKSGNLLNILGNPQYYTNTIFSSHFRYLPEKVAVGLNDYVYVISANVFDGIMEFDRDGKFCGFIGAPRVRPNPWDYFWRQISTEEQRARMALFLPIEFSNLDIDEYGFIFTTDYGIEEPIKKLNPSGQDVLQREGFFIPESRLIDITARKNMYSVLDGRTGQIFTYDNRGNLLYIFGGLGFARGMFRRPTAIASMEEYLLVTDSHKNNITVFEPTYYAKYIHEAIFNYESGFFERSTTLWRKVLQMNVNYDLAYSGIGLTLSNNNKYQQAMKYYRLGQNRNGYSRAFAYFRQEIIRENANIIFAVIIILIIFTSILLKYSLFYKLKLLLKSITKTNISTAVSIEVESDAKNNIVQKAIASLLYCKYLIFHPFAGFWDLKSEKKGNIPAATIILLTVSFTYVFMRQYTGFIFNFHDLNQLNIFREIANIIFPFAIWCLVNWGFTTLMDGKGTLKEIYIYSAFALTPIILINLPVTIISNFLIIEEGAFYLFSVNLALFWAMCLLLIGTIVTHSYGVSRTLLTVICIIIGMATVIFIGLLFFLVLDQMFGFVSDILMEITYSL